MSTPSILILGRPNVGKSTFFNQVIGQKKAIVCDIPGVTRDLIFSYSNWEDHHFIIMDSGGIFFDKPGSSPISFLPEIESRVKTAMDEADILLFMLDGKSGLTPYDEAIADVLRKYQDKLIVVVNKTDNVRIEHELQEVYSIGFEDVHFISSIQKQGINDLLDSIFQKLPSNKQGYKKTSDSKSIPISIIGRPNVGKSTLANTLIGENRILVSEIPGTTRDSTDHTIKYHDQTYTFVDTAGLTKKAKFSQSIDFYSYIRTIRSISDSYISLFIIDATQGIGEHEKHIGNLIIEQGNSIVIVVNKWDAIQKDSRTMEEYTKYVHQKLSFLTYAPIVYLSALENKRIHTLFKAINNVYKARQKQLSRNQLQSLLKTFLQSHRYPNPKVGGKAFNLRQLPSPPPHFRLFVNKQKYFSPGFTKSLQNFIRESFSFPGNQINLSIKSLKEKTIK